jgi:hypothetical protein
MNLEELEPRTCAAGDVVVSGRLVHAFDGWEGEVSRAEDASRGKVYGGAGRDGGPRVAVFDLDGNRLYDFFPFEPEFRGGVRVYAGGGNFYCLPGPGGGPVVARYDGRTATQEDRAFYGDPESRDGLASLPAAAVETHFRSEAYPPNPGATGLVDLSLSYLTESDAARLRGSGAKVRVYGGYGLFNVPELASLRGYAPGAPEGTVGNVSYVPEMANPMVVLHGVGHLISDTWKPDQQLRFLYPTWAESDWPYPYEELLPGEASAGAFQRDRMGLPNPPLATAFLAAELDP